MSNLERPVFIECSPDEITRQNVELYETIVGKTLYPAQPERLFIDVISYRECLLRQAVQLTAEQNLVEYARDAALDHLAQNIGVYRLAARPACCSVQITLNEEAAGNVVISQGLELVTNDGLFTFITVEDCTVLSGALTGTCSAECSSVGTDANGYLPGSLRLVGNIDGVQTATNLDTTSGGSDDEEDDAFRERIPLALEAYSCAGPALAYKYWALSAHNSIIDVSVISPSAGVINIYPLTADGAPSPHVMELIAAACNDEKRRPLTDSVNVLAPQAVHFTVNANLTLYGNTDRTSVLSKINRLLGDYQKEIRLQMGRDIVPSQLSALIHVEGVYSVEITSPDLVRVDGQSYPVLDSWNINIGSVVYE
ncbi:MAG: baseplate J/gp47 family protein [Synergistaceae bacterium]|nr:baseplate J/gp47 family protein [Synergistaceae bacterium]MBQ6909646.1 baseplate J/gp47 family protein [Synergistaceae bacterium]